MKSRFWDIFRTKNGAWSQTCSIFASYGNRIISVYHQTKNICEHYTISMDRIIFTRANIILHDLQDELAESYADMRRDYEPPYKSHWSNAERNRNKFKSKTVGPVPKRAAVPRNSNAAADSRSTDPGWVEDVEEPITNLEVSLAEKSRLQEAPEELRDCMVEYRRVEAWKRRIEGQFERAHSSYARKRKALDTLTRAPGSTPDDLEERLEHFRPGNENQERLLKSFVRLRKMVDDLEDKTQVAKDELWMCARIIADVVFELYGHSVPSAEGFASRDSVDDLSSSEADAERQLTQSQIDVLSDSGPDLSSRAESRRRREAAASRRVKARWNLQDIEAEFESY